MLCKLTITLILTLSTLLLNACGGPTADLQHAEIEPAATVDSDYLLAQGLFKLILIPARQDQVWKEDHFGLSALFFAPTYRNGVQIVGQAPKAGEVDQRERVHTNMAATLAAIQGLQPGQQKSLTLRWKHVGGYEHSLVFTAKQTSTPAGEEVHLVLEELRLAGPYFWQSTTVSGVKRPLESARADYGNRTVWVAFAVDKTGIVKAAHPLKGEGALWYTKRRR